MLKLKEETIERLVRAYKKHLQKIRDEFDLDDLYGNEIIERDDFEEVEELKPYVWYKKEDFDGNPKNYWIIERYKYGGLVLTSGPMYLDSLEDQTTHFMLVEPFDEAKDDAS